MLEAARRISNKPLNRKIPITAENIKKIYKQFREEKKKKNCSLFHLRTLMLLIIVIGFAGFVRYSEMADFVFQETHLEIFIEKSKTDIYRDGLFLFLAKT